MAALLLWTGVALDVAVLVGLFVRRRWHQARLLPVVIVAALCSTVVVGICPGCNTWTLWLVSEFTHITLLLLLGLELSLRAFPRGSPGRRAVVLWLSSIAVATTAAVSTKAALIDWLPLLIAAVLAVYVGLTLVMAHYAVALGALHDALLYGFPAYLLVYVATWGFTGDDTRLANLASPLAFDVFMSNLMCVAWQRNDIAAHPFALAACARRLAAWLRRSIGKPRSR